MENARYKFDDFAGYADPKNTSTSKGRIFRTVILNRCLDDVTSVSTMRKPFDVFVEGLLLLTSRGDRI